MYVGPMRWHRTSTRSFLTLVLALFAVSRAARADQGGKPEAAPDQPEQQPEPRAARAGRGFGFVSADGADSLLIHGLLQADYQHFAGRVPDGAPGRGAFVLAFAGVGLDTTLYRVFHSALLVDFAESRAKVIFGFVEARIHPLLTVRAGKFPMPISGERLTPETELPWVSYSPASLALPAADVGIQVYGELPKALVRYNLALVDGATAGATSGKEDDTPKDVVGRVLLSPFATTGVAALAELGLGMGASTGIHHGTRETPLTPVLRTYGRRTWFEFRGPAPVETPGMPAAALADGKVIRLVPHVTYSVGPFAAYADWSHERSAFGRTEVFVDAASASATVSLTGERTRPFSRIEVRHPLDLPGGYFGGLQLVAGGGVTRISASAFPTLADPAVAMRRARVVGAGVNWYPTTGLGLLVDVSHTSFDAFGTSPFRADETAINTRFEMVL